MNRLIPLSLAVVVAFSSTGCAPKTSNTPKIEKNKTEVNVETVKPKTAKNVYNEYIEEYKAFIAPVEKTTAVSVKEQESCVAEMKKMVKDKTAEEIFNYFKANIIKLEAPYSDQFTDMAIAALNTRAIKDSEAEFTEIVDPGDSNPYFALAKKYDFRYAVVKHHTNEATDEKFKKYIENAAQRGYLIEGGEGMIYYEVDYTEFAKYKNQYSQEYANYLMLLAYESIKNVTTDAALNISSDELIARTLEAEKSLKDYKGNEYQKRIAKGYIEYLGYLILGSDNSPTYDFQTNKIKSETIDVYKTLAALENTQISGFIKDHMKQLEASGGVFTDDVKKKLSDNCFNKLEKQYAIKQNATE